MKCIFSHDYTGVYKVEGYAEIIYCTKCGKVRFIYNFGNMKTEEFERLVREVRK